MRIRTNTENRKEVVKAVAEILNTSSKYLGVPSCNFQVGSCIIDRAGVVETEDEKTAEMVLRGLVERGLADPSETEEEKLLVSFSAEAIGASILAYAEEIRGIGISNEKITFRFPYTEDSQKAKAWTDLSAAMMKQTKEQKRIDSEERIEENEKYYMRIWLLRIGFGGKDMKDSRNILMENLKGHSAFRTQADIDRAKVRTKQREEDKKQAELEALEGEPCGSEAVTEETVAELEISGEGGSEEKTEPTEAA